MVLLSIAALMVMAVVGSRGQSVPPRSGKVVSLFSLHDLVSTCRECPYCISMQDSHLELCTLFALCWIQFRTPKYGTAGL